jgi:hypothetical protein
MLPEGEAVLRAVGTFQPSPATDARIEPVSAHNPSRTHELFSETNSVLRNTGDRGIPSQFDTGLCGSLRHDAMQLGTSNGAPALPSREECIRGKFRTQEPDSLERKGSVEWKLDLEPFERRQAIRHQAFAAGFVNRRLAAIGDDNAQASLSGCNSSSQAGRPTANHENVS